jgi:peptide chain release factor 2
MLHPDFWNDQQAAQTVISEANALKDQVNEFSDLFETFENLEVSYELVKEESDAELQAELEDELVKLTSRLNDFELQLLLSEEYDKHNAILELHPGAGGTESQDEAGIKSVTLAIRGHNAYGYLKAEKGVHRLVRISPFDSSGRRHTSFVSCEVMPEFNDEIEIEIRTEDLKIDTYRASGAGGQHINTTDSAVRITHTPTGVVVTCQNERSQIKNREAAMKMLKAKLYQREIEQQEKELLEIRGEQKEIGWGSQIRSYVFHPYSMVKDHRTSAESGNVQGVMDGDIDQFIDAYLRSRIS